MMVLQSVKPPNSVMTNEHLSLLCSAKIDPSVYEKAARYAVRVHEEMSKRSTLLNEPKQGSSGKSSIIAKFDKEEVLPYLGDLLGKGGFNSVYELERIQLIKECPETQRQRNLILSNKPKLAVKFLSDEAYEKPDNAGNGSADLYMEAMYLSALTSNHPHPALIQLHGISSAGHAGLSIPSRGGFLLLSIACMIHWIKESMFGRNYKGGS
jgi:hypothetical protein